MYERFEVLGLMKTGTNVMSRIVQQMGETSTFVHNKQVVHGWVQLDKLYCPTVPMWKHAYLPFVQFPESCHRVIIMVRDPFTWIQSMRNNCYDFEWDKSLHTPLRLPMATQRGNILRAVHPYSILAVELWNDYVRTACSLADEQPGMFIVVRMEDLLNREKMISLSTLLFGRFDSDLHMKVLTTDMKVHMGFRRWWSVNPADVVKKQMSNRVCALNASDRAYLRDSLDKQLCARLHYKVDVD